MAELPASLTDGNRCRDTTCTWTGRVSQKLPLSPRSVFLPSLLFLQWKPLEFKKEQNYSPRILSLFFFKKMFFVFLSCRSCSALSSQCLQRRFNASSLNMHITTLCSVPLSSAPRRINILLFFYFILCVGVCMKTKIQRYLFASKCLMRNGGFRFRFSLKIFKKTAQCLPCWFFMCLLLRTWRTYIHIKS